MRYMAYMEQTIGAVPALGCYVLCLAFDRARSHLALNPCFFVSIRAPPETLEENPDMRSDLAWLLTNRAESAAISSSHIYRPAEEYNT